MSFKVVVDMDLCQDHGQCVFAAPDVFELNADGRLEVLVTEPGDERRTACEDAADVCPVQAITLEG